MIDWALAAAAIIAILYVVFFPKRKRPSEFLKSYESVEFNVAAAEKHPCHKILCGLDEYLEIVGFDRAWLYRNRENGDMIYVYVNRNYSVFFEISLEGDEFRIGFMTQLLSGTIMLSSDMEPCAEILAGGWVIFRHIEKEGIAKLKDAPAEDRGGAFIELFESHVNGLSRSAERGDRPAYCNARNYLDCRDYFLACKSFVKNN